MWDSHVTFVGWAEMSTPLSVPLFQHRREGGQSSPRSWFSVTPNHAQGFANTMPTDLIWTGSDLAGSGHISRTEQRFCLQPCYVWFEHGITLFDATNHTRTALRPGFSILSRLAQQASSRRPAFFRLRRISFRVYPRSL